MTLSFFFRYSVILYSGDQNHFSQQQQAHQLSAGVSGLTPTNGVFASSVLTNTSNSVINTSEESTVSTASSVYISLPPASTATPIELLVERREQKTGGKGTFSSISAVAAAAGHVNPLLKSAQLDDSTIPGTVKIPVGIASGPPFQPPSSSLTANLGMGPLGVMKTTPGPGPRIPGPGVDEISLPQRNLGPPTQPLLGREMISSLGAVTVPSTAEVPTSTVGAVKNTKTASGKAPIVKEKVSVKEVKISRTSQTKAQREKVKERKAREVAEKEQEKEAEKELEKEKEREREKEREKEKEKEKEREREKEKERLKEEKERDAAAAAIASAVITHHDLKLESVTALTRRKELTTTKLISLERKAMLARKGPPPYLPRPKVHWDYLLDEMQWMSIDFKQERRLKLALCHSISLMCSAAAVERMNRINDSNKVKERESEVAMDVSPRHSLNTVSSTQDTGCTDNAFETENSILESTPMDLEQDILPSTISHTLILSSADKIKNRKIIAAYISDMIKHHWQATSDVIDVHNKEAIQLLRVYKEHQDEEIDDDLSPVTPSPLPLPSITPETCLKKVKEKEILLKCLQDTAILTVSTETSNNFTGAGADSTEVSRDFHKKSKFSCPIKLLKHQLFALKQTIDRNNLGYGVLLCGKNYTGRTTLCALIAETWSTNSKNSSHRLDANKDKSADVTVKTEKDTAHIKEDFNENDEKVSDGPRTESGIHSKYFQEIQSSPQNKLLKKNLISIRKKPALVLVPRCGLIRWYSELKRTYAGCNVQLGFSNGKSHDNFKVEKLEGNCVEKEGEKGTWNTSTSTSESENERKYVIGSEPDVILCALENLHNLLEHCKRKNFNEKEEESSKMNGSIENTENGSDWCGIIVDSRSLNMAAMRSTMLLCMKSLNPEISNIETAIKKQNDIGLKIKQEGRIYTSTVVLLNQTTATTTAATATTAATTSTVPTQNTIKKKKDLHWLNCLSDMLPPSLCNRCYLKSEKNIETAADNNSILSFLIPELRSTIVEVPMGGPTGGQVQSLLPTILTDMNEIEVLKRLCVLVEVSEEDDVITQSRAKEEIITYDMDSVQRRKYVIAMDYFITQGILSGTNITNLAKATIILKRLCYHQDMIYIDVENEEEVIERNNSKGSTSHTHVRTKSDLTVKDLPKIITEGKDKSSSGSMDLGSLIPKDNIDASEENNKSDDKNNVNENNDSSVIDYNDNKNDNKNDNHSNDRTSLSNIDKNNDKNDNSIARFSSSSLTDMKMDVCTDIVLACTDKSIPTSQEIILESDRLSGGTKNGKGNVPSFTLVDPQRYTPNEDVCLPGNTSYRTTSPAYVSGSKQHLWFSVGLLSSKLKSPVSFNMTSHVSPLSPHFASSSLSPSFTSSNTTSPTVCTERSNGGDETPNFRKNNMMLQNQMACVGSYKLQALEGLLLRFIGQRVAILSETEEEMLAVHRFVSTCVCVFKLYCVCILTCLLKLCVHVCVCV